MASRPSAPRTVAGGVIHHRDQTALRTLGETRRREQEHPIEEVGAWLRAMMPFLKPVSRREPVVV